jgi:tRNA (mo5U34)-methyltransferase
MLLHILNSQMQNLYDNITLLDSLWQREDLLGSLMPVAKKEAYLSYREAVLKDLTRDVWQEVISNFSGLDIKKKSFDVVDGVVHAGEKGSANQEELNKLLKSLIPWRKGPWNFAGIDVDAEWRSNIKYTELAQIVPLVKDKLVFDIGGGNGYYGFCLRHDGAGTVVNFDPSEKFFYQFELAQSLIQDPNIQYEPLGYQDVHKIGIEADVVMSMGVLYHQKDPLAVLEASKSSLKPGGLLIVESMSIPGDSEHCLFPEDRYAKARNVYFLPSKKALCNLCKRAGFVDVEIISDRDTTLDEQRSTNWMPYESLSEFLDTKDISRTIEGYPAPRRTMVIARKKIHKKHNRIKEDCSE